MHLSHFGPAFAGQTSRAVFGKNAGKIHELREITAPQWDCQLNLPAGLPGMLPWLASGQSIDERAENPIIRCPLDPHLDDRPLRRGLP